ncbi:MAG: hypothetical protein ABSE73_08260 [Planctomycetota bacterium]
MSDAPKKRPWFRFHLSTAVLLMLVAGILLGLNFHVVTDGVLYIVFGWPFQVYWPDLSNRSSSEGPSPTMELGVLMCDVAVCFAILYFLWRISEWHIRRKERRQ